MTVLVVTPAKDDGYAVMHGQDFVVGDEVAFSSVDDLEHCDYLLVKISNWVVFQY